MKEQLIEKLKALQDDYPNKSFEELLGSAKEQVIEETEQNINRIYDNILWERRNQSEVAIDNENIATNQ